VDVVAHHPGVQLIPIITKHTASVFVVIALSCGQLEIPRHELQGQSMAQFCIAGITFFIS